MAIRQSRSLTATFTHVWVDDPGLDKKAEAYNHEAFDESGDMAHLPVLPGESLTVFHLAPLNQRQKLAVQQLIMQKRPAEAFYEAAALALQSVDGFTLLDGTALVIKRKRNGFEGETRCAEESLRPIPAEAILDIGARVATRSDLRPKNG